MIEVTPTIRLDESELQYDFIRASGPGGQNVNKVASAVQLRFDVRRSPSLPADVKERLLRLAGSRITREGVLVIEARRFRTQEANRSAATARLIALIQKALQPPRPRKPTRPGPAARAARLEQKKKRSLTKRQRREPPED